MARHLALRFPEALPGGTCRQWLRRVYDARPDWNADFGGEQFSLGRAWYTHCETGQSDAYFHRAAPSNALLDRQLPDMKPWLFGWLSGLVQGHVEQRPGWCGPGVHVFPAGEKVAREGGVVHYDVEGLPHEHLRRGKPALSLVLMLQPPESGGGLRVWDQRFTLEDGQEVAEPGCRQRLLGYEAGTLIVQDSYRLHQIQPFGGQVDRVSVTCMAAEVDPGYWQVWF